MTDAVVIGSGFGGGITATRLAEGGVNVTLLERGPWWDTVPTRSLGIENRTPFPRGMQLFTRSIRSLSHPLLSGRRVLLNKKGLFDLYFSSGMEVICASGVGGGSHVYSAVHRRPVQDGYWDGYFDDLGGNTMEVHYQNFLSRMDSTKPNADNRPPHTAAEIYRDDPHFEPVIPQGDVRTGFLLPKDPGHPGLVTDQNGIQRWEADYKSGDHGFLGAPSGSKTTVEVTYIAPALKKGLVVRAMSEVLAIECNGGGGRRFTVRFRDLSKGTIATIQSDYVFVGAGTMNTLRLLLESRDRYRTLDGMPNLGRGFSGNGDIRGFWDINDSSRDLTEGLPSKGSLFLRDNAKSRIAISRNGLPSVTAYPFPRFIRERLKRGLVVAGMGVDAADGVATVKNGRFRIDFNPDNSPIYGAIHETLLEAGRRSGRKVYVKARPSTVHPMGGAAIGAFEKGGTVDSNGEVHGQPGLFVVDAAVFPKALGTAPSMSIGAWAENVSARFLARPG